MPSARTEAMLQKMAKANDAGDTEAYLSFFHKDAVRKYGNQEQRGKDALKAFMAPFNNAMTDRSFEIARVLVAEDDLAVIEYHEWYTHVKPLHLKVGELPPSNKPLEIFGVTVMELEDGLIKEIHVYSNGGYEILANSPVVQKALETAAAH